MTQENTMEKQDNVMTMLTLLREHTPAEQANILALLVSESEVDYKCHDDENGFTIQFSGKWGELSKNRSGTTV